MCGRSLTGSGVLFAVTDYPTTAEEKVEIILNLKSLEVDYPY